MAWLNFLKLAFIKAINQLCAGRHVAHRAYVVELFTNIISFLYLYEQDLLFNKSCLYNTEAIYQSILEDIFRSKKFVQKSPPPPLEPTWGLEYRHKYSVYRSGEPGAVLPVQRVGYTETPGLPVSMYLSSQHCFYTDQADYIITLIPSRVADLGGSDPDSDPTLKKYT